MGTSIEQTQSNKLRWVTGVLWALVLAGLAYLAGLTLWLGVRGLLFPYQLDYGEGTHLHYTRELALGRPIYRPIGTYPFITSNYAPLPFLLALALTPLLGMTYAAGRIWTLLAILAAAAVILIWIKKEAGGWLPAAVAALLFVGSPYVYHWAPLFRVDLIGLALTMGGLFAVYLALPQGPTAANERQKPYLLVLAVILFVAALYAKQSYLFAPAAALIYLFFFVSRRQAVLMTAAIGLLGGGLFLVINALTGGSFWESMVVANVNPFLWPEFWQQQRSFFGAFAILALLAAWYILDKFILHHTTPLRAKIRLLDVYLPLALSSVLLAGKAGAWENYFFEALAAFVLAGGLGLAQLIRSPKPLSRIVAPLLVLAQVVLMWHTPEVASRYLRLTQQSYEEMAPILAGTPDPIFAEDMGLLVTYDKVLDYHSFEYSQLAEAGRWDQSWELDQLRDRNRSLVILDRGTRLDVDRYRRFTRAFLSELDRNYKHTRTVGKFELYEPDPLQHERKVGFGEELALVGWSLHASPDLGPGDTVRLTVVWQAQKPLTTDYTAFAHLVDGVGQGLAGDDHQPYDGVYPTSAWGDGEMVRDSFTLPVPADAPPGLYAIEVGWYEATTGARLPANGGQTFRIAVLPVGAEATGPQSVEPVGVSFGELITLQGYDTQVDRESIRLTLRWSADGYVDNDYTVFAHLIDSQAGNEALAQSDSAPMGGSWPTSLWLPGVALDDIHTIPIPEELSPGSYELLVGLYDPVTGARLLLPGGNDSYHLTEIELP